MERLEKGVMWWCVRAWIVKVEGAKLSTLQSWDLRVLCACNYLLTFSCMKSHEMVTASSLVEGPAYRLKVPVRPVLTKSEIWPRYTKPRIPPISCTINTIRTSTMYCKQMGGEKRCG